MAGILRAEKKEGERLPYLLIGGHAIVLHGVPRNTFDLDLMIPEASLDSRCDFLNEQGLVEFHRTGGFVQFQGSGKNPPLDLIVVTQETFDKICEGSESKHLGRIDVRVPSSSHMVALKPHAIQQAGRRLKVKDWGDVIALIQSCGLDLENDHFRAFILRYGGINAEDEIRKRLTAGGLRTDSPILDGTLL